MLRWRIRSALYIDFENVPLPPDAIASWLAWLEDAAFDAAGRRRRFLQKRVYWNSHAERNRELFQRHGFVPILVGKFAGLKNGADIRMAMDVVEATYTRSEIDEYILLTGDSDFVPVLERLRHKAKRSAIVATEHRPNIHTTYQLNADILIPSRRLTEAAQYRRPRPGLFARMFTRPTPAATRPGRPPPIPAASPAPTPARPTSPARPVRVALDVPSPADPTPIIETAAKRVAKLLAQQPRNYVSQKRVLAELDRLQGFKRQGPTAYLGTGGYKSLMKELAVREPRITVVDQPGGGTGIVFIPPPGPGDAAPPASPIQSALQSGPVIPPDARVSAAATATPLPTNTVGSAPGELAPQPDAPSALSASSANMPARRSPPAENPPMATALQHDALT